METCTFCNKTFSKLSGLTRHQKTSKTCLSIQNQERSKNHVNESEVPQSDNKEQLKQSIHTVITNNNVDNFTYNINVNIQDFINVQIYDISITREKLVKSDKEVSANEIKHVDDENNIYIMETDVEIYIAAIREKKKKSNKEDVLFRIADVLKECANELDEYCKNVIDDEIKETNKITENSNTNSTIE